MAISCGPILKSGRIVQSHDVIIVFEEDHDLPDLGYPCCAVNYLVFLFRVTVSVPFQLDRDFWVGDYH